MKIARRNKHRAEVSTHSLNDIMFFLLLFFLILSTMAHPNVIKVMLPESKEAASKESKQNAQLTVDAEKHYFLESIPCTAEELERKLELLAAKDSTIGVSIQMDKSLSVQDLVDVMEMGKRQQVKMFLKTTQPQ
ncbi:MAG: biopolymer transporter ExbD [Bacteroidetes bacterium]|nr:biopolymer transporter ExbD [Bacteroidota bacterium]